MKIEKYLQIETIFFPLAIIWCYFAIRCFKCMHIMRPSKNIAVTIVKVDLTNKQYVLKVLGILAASI